MELSADRGAGVPLPLAGFCLLQSVIAVFF